MRKKLFVPALLVALALTALVVAGCGSGVPADSVATVDGTSIKKSEFEHWLSVASKQQAVSGQTAVVPDPPNYTKCVAALQKVPVAKGQAKPSAAALKSQCEQQYEGLKQQVMQFLVQSEWLLKEADSRKLTAKPATVQKQLDDQIKQSFPKRADFDTFLKQSGMTMNDLHFRVKIDVLTQQVRQKIVAGRDKVSDAQIASYYSKNQSRFAQPERRDLEVVLTKTKDKAEQAKAEIDSGTAWSKVAKKYSIDQASKAQGGKLPGVAKGQQEKAFDSAIFSADKGKVIGPVKTQFGYYVFKVDSISKASQQTEQQAHDTILNIIRSQQEQDALNKFVADYQKRYTKKTNCRSGFVTQECKNAPKTKTNTAATTPPPAGAVPQNGGTSAPPAGGTTSGG